MAISALTLITMPPYTAQIHSLSTPNIDELETELHSLQIPLKIKKLTKGPNSYQFNWLNYGSYALLTTQFSAPLYLDFLTQKNGLSFYVPCSCNEYQTVHYKPIERHTLAVIPPATTTYGFTLNNYSGFFLFIDYPTIKKFLQSQHPSIKNTEAYIPTTRTFYTISAEAYESLCHSLHEVLAIIHNDRENQEKDYRQINHALKEAIIPKLSNAIINSAKLWPLHSEEENIFSRALKIIENQVDKPISTKIIADQLNISERTLQKSFQKKINMTPTELIRSLRLDRLRRSLKNSPIKHGNISQLANDLGFWHMGQLSKDFKAYFQYSPKNYNQINQKPEKSK